MIFREYLFFVRCNTSPALTSSNNLQDKVLQGKNMFTANKRFAPGIGKLLLSSVLLSSVFMSTNTLASGSFGGGSGIGAHNSYNLGKSVFHKKLICQTCPATGTEMSKSGALKIIKKLETDQDFAHNLNDKKRMAVVEYLSRRFQLN